MAKVPGRIPPLAVSILEVAAVVAEAAKLQRIPVALALPVLGDTAELWRVQLRARGTVVVAEAAKLQRNPVALAPPVLGDTAELWRVQLHARGAA